LVACADSLMERVRSFASVYGVERLYGSYEALIKDEDVDAVYVATPNALHCPVTRAAARAGKNVLCQKPMALTGAEAEEMIAACHEAGVTLRIGLQLRFQKILQAVADQVRQGRIGSVREVTVQRYAPIGEAKASAWRYELALAGAGALADVGVHVVDFVQWIVGDRIRRVFASAQPGRASGRPDETVTVLLEFAGGCQVTVRCSREMPLGANDLQIFGTGGMLITGPLRGVPQNRLTVRTPEGDEETEYPAGNLHLQEIEAFAEAVAGAPTPAATGEDGLRLVRLTEALIRSLETGCAIMVEESERHDKA
jgi:1,5-anhydro-D-fructose reductase (1,5-anhydro-D-mannitol-forming)